MRQRTGSYAWVVNAQTLHGDDMSKLVLDGSAGVKSANGAFVACNAQVRAIVQIHFALCKTSETISADGGSSAQGRDSQQQKRTIATKCVLLYFVMQHEVLLMLGCDGRRPSTPADEPRVREPTQSSTWGGGARRKMEESKKFSTCSWTRPARAHTAVAARPLSAKKCVRPIGAETTRRRRG